MINKEIYNTPELMIISFTEEVIRTSTPTEAPDVFTGDPFAQD